MYLYLNTTERDSFQVALADKGVVLRDKTILSARAHSEKLLRTVSGLLSQSKKSVKDIKGIAVVQGPGSFTSLRVGVATANALGFALGVPVAGVSKDYRPGSAVRWPKSKRIQLVIPEYGSEPHITSRGRI